jgi:hypothetical protein
MNGSPVVQLQDRYLPAGWPTGQRHPVPVCGCGQDLDVAIGKHCPRCGIAVMVATPVARGRVTAEQH